MIHGNAAAVRDLPARFGNVESVTIEEIVEFAPILPLNPLDSPETQENEEQKRKD